MKLKPVTEGKLENSQSVVEIKHTLKQQLDQRKKITREIRKYFKRNESKISIYQNL